MIKNGVFFVATHQCNESDTLDWREPSSLDMNGHFVNQEQNTADFENQEDTDKGKNLYKFHHIISLQTKQK